MAGNVILKVFGVNASLWFNNVMGNVGRIYQNAGKNVVQKIFKVAKVIFKTFAFSQISEFIQFNVTTKYN